MNDLNKHQLEEATRLLEINHKEEKDREERARCEAVIRKVECLRERAKREASQRHEAEIKAMCDVKEVILSVVLSTTTSFKNSTEISVSTFAIQI